MGRKCAVYSCPHRKKKGLAHVHRFPNKFKTPRLHQIWIDKTIDYTAKPSINPENFGVCDEHFKATDFLNDTKSHGGLLLKPTAIPSLKLSKTDRNQDIENLQANECLNSEQWIAKTANVENNETHPTEGAIQFTSTANEMELLPVEDIYKLQIEALEFKLKKAEMRITLISRANNTLRTQVRRMRIEINNQERKTEDRDELLARFFSEGQMRLIKGDYCQYIHWNEAEISSQLTLYSVSSRAYSYLRDVLNYPLASVSTLKRWLKKINVSPGKLLAPIMKLLQLEFHDACPQKSACTLAIDEMAIHDKYCYDPSTDTIYGGKNNVCVIAIRGILYPWKQVIYYDWAKNPSMFELVEIILSLRTINIDVKCIVTDMGGKNIGLWKEFEVAKVTDGVLGKTWFDHPLDGTRIHFIADYMHLLKLHRNHTVDAGLTFNDGSILNRKIMEDLLKQQKSEFRLTPNLTHKDIYCTGQQRQNVASAFRFFSIKTSKAIRVLLPGNVTAANYIEGINDLTDIFNVHYFHLNYNPYKAPYGLRLKEQDALLDYMYDEISKVKVGNRKEKRYAPFQKGLLMNITSLKELFKDLSSEHGIKYLLTSHISQDFLENIFSQVRGIGGSNMNPTAFEFKHRLKKLICIWSMVTPKTAPVKETEEELGMVSSRLLSVLTTNEEPEPYQEVITENFSERLNEINCAVEENIMTFDDINWDSRAEEGGKEYVAGYIARRFLHDYPEMSKPGAEETHDSFWIGFLSDGGIMEPSLFWHGLFCKFEEVFQILHPDKSCNKTPGIVKALNDTLLKYFPNAPVEVINFYSKCRTLIRIKYLNLMLEDKKAIRKEQKRLSIQEAMRNSIVSDDNQPNEQQVELMEEDLLLIENLIGNNTDTPIGPEEEYALIA